MKPRSGSEREDRGTGRSWRVLSIVLGCAAAGCASGVEIVGDGEGGGDAALVTSAAGSTKAAGASTSKSATTAVASGSSNTSAAQTATAQGATANQATTTGGALPVGPGDLVINEIMANPDLASDTYAEWLELYNATDHAIDLQGLIFRHEANDPAAVHLIDASVVVAAHGMVVIGKDDDVTRNGGVSVAYVYPPDIGFTNTGDYLAIERADGTIVDHVFWAADAPLGAAWSLDPAYLLASSNDDPSHFCPATAFLPMGDRGTPNAPNPPCN